MKQLLANQTLDVIRKMCTALEMGS